MHGGPEGLTLNPDQRIVLFEMIDTNKSFFALQNESPTLHLFILFYAHISSSSITIS